MTAVGPGSSSYFVSTGRREQPFRQWPALRVVNTGAKRGLYVQSDLASVAATALAL